MGGDIVEEAVGGSEVKLGGVGLVRGELTDGSEDGEVQGSGVEEQGSNHPLDPGFLRGRDWWGGRGGGERHVGMGRGRRVNGRRGGRPTPGRTEMREHGGNVVGHREGHAG